MKFSNFAQILASALREDTISVFTRTLFDVTLPEEDKKRLEVFTDNDFRNYYYGTTNINKIKRTIGMYMQFNLFEYFISAHNLTAKKKLCENFPNATISTIGARTSEIFNQIMLNDTWGGGARLSGETRMG